MAKQFLEMLGDEFEDHILDEVIPLRTSRPQQKKTLQKKKEKPVSQRKRARVKSSSKKSGRKSFLQTIEEALENHAFDDLIPETPRPKKKISPSPTDIAFEKKLSSMIPPEVLSRLRKIAQTKGIAIKDVIRIALKWYVEKEGSV